MLQNTDKDIVIWGAGKIGRGFIADVFSENGYRIVLVDENKSLAEELDRQGSYTIFASSGKGPMQKKTITDYSAVYSGDRQRTDDLLTSAGLMAVAVFPDALDKIAQTLSHAVRLRIRAGQKKFLNILVCANLLGARSILEQKLYSLLNEEEKKFAQQNLGIAGTVIIRLAIRPPDEILKTDPLAVLTDRYPNLIVDGRNLKGTPENLKSVVYVSDIEAQETRKMYVYNMAHAVIAYLAASLGHAKVNEAVGDPEVKKLLKLTLKEVSEGLIAEFQFDRDEMLDYCNDVIDKFGNPLLDDTLKRVGGDVVRKIGRTDRLVGPALLCRNNGVYPYYLAKAVSFALRFHDDEDQSAAAIHKTMAERPLIEAVGELCGIRDERDLAYLISRHYQKTDLYEDEKRVALLKDAFHKGYMNEKQYKGCAQCALMSMFETAGRTDKHLFQAASGFSGGMALCGDGVCGGYSGGILFTGSQSGRRLDEMIAHGDKQEQYNSYEMAQVLHDRFIECYGSVICADIHRAIFGGRDFCLRTKEVRDRFEEAGAHTDKCTAVVGTSCVWITEVLLDRGLISSY